MNRMMCIVLIMASSQGTVAQKGLPTTGLDDEHQI
jgi:hypothetical protein